MRDLSNTEPPFPDLLEIPDVDLSWWEPLARHTTFRVGGPVACLARPGSEKALLALVAGAKGLGIPTFVLGGGSNILAPDAPWAALAIKLDRCSSSLRPLERSGAEGVQLYAGSGIRVAQLLRYCVQNSLGGVEFLAGIPGTIGGAVVMNAGTREGAMADSLLYIDIIDRSGEVRRLAREDLAASYRSMGLPSGVVVLGACLRLRPGSGDALRVHLRELMRRRRRTQPLGLPSAGCIFKNSPGASAGALIDRAGLKGHRIGGAEISPVHANWIVNRGRASALEILELMGVVEDRVFERFGIRLEREVKCLGA